MKYSPAIFRCTRCLYNEETPSITFDDHGICNYCAVHDRMDREHPTGAEGEKYLKTLATQIKKEGKRKEFDIVVGVSGGTDSSYLVYLSKELGLRPLAVHFDNTWDSSIASQNMSRVLDVLNVPLFTYVVNNEEYNDIYRSFLLAGVRDVESPTDIGLASTLYMAAEQYGIRYIFEGHSFRTEGIAPLGWLYMDGKYIESVVKQYGHYEEHQLATFPNLTLARFLKWTALCRIKKIRPLYYIDYNKSNVQKLLTEKFGWENYGGHHLENRFTRFYHTCYMPRRFGIDMRLLGYSALVRSGQMTREEGLTRLVKPPEIETELLSMVKTRLGFSDEEFQRIMQLPEQHYSDFRTYKKTFERLRPLFWIMAKLHLVPQSFYIKYTSTKEI